jgi:hypothetical protein
MRECRRFTAETVQKLDTKRCAGNGGLVECAARTSPEDVNEMTLRLKPGSATRQGRTPRV